MNLERPESIFHLSESIDFENVVTIRHKGERHMQEHPSVTFDFSAVKYCDSSALALLVAWKRFSKQHQIKMTFANIPLSLKAYAEVCNVRAILTL